MAASGSSTTNLRLRYDVGGDQVHYYARRRRCAAIRRRSVLQREDSWPVVPDGDRVLPVRGARAVGCDDGPFVVQHNGLSRAEGEHRFDSEHRTRCQVGPAAWRSLVGQERVHVHLTADAVSAVAGDDAELATVTRLGGVRFGLDGV